MKMRIINPLLRMLSLDNFDDSTPTQQEVSKVTIVDATSNRLNFEDLFSGDDVFINKAINELQKEKTYFGFQFYGEPKLSNSILFYIGCVVAIGDGFALSSIGSKEKGLAFDSPNYYYWMYTLATKIAIRLVEETEMPESKIKGDYATETLGCYFSSHEKFFNQPIIFLCPSRIEKITKGLNIEESVLYAIVLIHELAHAIMDPTNIIKDGCLVKCDSQKALSEMDHAMEEAFANMITLQYFDKVQFVFNDIEVVKDFMMKQPEAYKFGITLYNTIKPDWKEWRKNKSAFIVMEKLAQLVSQK